MRKFLEAHNYDLSDETCYYKYPFTSHYLKEHLDEISYKVFKDFEEFYDPDKVDTLIDNINPILEVAFFLDIEKVKKISNVVL